MHPRRSSALETLVATVRSWPGVKVVPHRFGGVAFRLGHTELGHIHADGTLDLQFPRALRDRLVDEGWANMHHVLPASGWVTIHIAVKADIDQALRLLRLADLRRRLCTTANDDEALHEAAQLDASPELLATLLARQPMRVSGVVH